MKEKILVVVSGMTPQIITETVFALAQKQWIPNRIVALTTLAGAEKIKSRLLGENGYFRRLRQEYDLPDIHFDEHSIEIIRDEDGSLEDIRTPEQNNAAADMIVRWIRDLCADKNTELHISIAGGRKSMGFYIGYALSLFGRKQDKMSHVLVEEAFETHPEFFYPPKNELFLNTSKHGMMDASKAQVMLAEIPFVRMGGGKVDWTLTEGQTFSQAVMCIQEMLDDTQVVIDVEKGHIHFGTVCVDNLAPREFSVYLTMAQLCIDGRKIKQEEEEELARLVWANYKNRRKKSDEFTLEKWLEDDGVKLGSFFWARFGEDRSNIAKKFRKVMGEYGKQFTIHAEGKRNKLYYLPLEPSSINIQNKS